MDVNKIRLTSKSQKELLFSSPNQNNLHQVLHILPHQLLPREMHDSASFSEFHWGLHPRPRPIMPALRMDIEHDLIRQLALTQPGPPNIAVHGLTDPKFHDHEPAGAHSFSSESPLIIGAKNDSTSVAMSWSEAGT